MMYSDKHPAPGSSPIHCLQQNIGQKSHQITHWETGLLLLYTTRFAFTDSLMLPASTSSHSKSAIDTCIVIWHFPLAGFSDRRLAFIRRRTFQDFTGVCDSSCLFVAMWYFPFCSVHRELRRACAAVAVAHTHTGLHKHVSWSYYIHQGVCVSELRINVREEGNVCWSACMVCLRRRHFLRLHSHLLFPPTCKTTLSTTATFRSTRKYQDTSRKMFPLHHVLSLRH